jgi:hypothetical protein
MWKKETNRVIESQDIIWLNEWYFNSSAASNPLLEPYEGELEFNDTSDEWANMESAFPDFTCKVTFANAVDQNPNPNTSEATEASGTPNQSVSAPANSILKTTRSGQAVKPVERMNLGDIESGEILAAELNYFLRLKERDHDELNLLNLIMNQHQGDSTNLSPYELMERLFDGLPLVWWLCSHCLIQKLKDNWADLLTRKPPRTPAVAGQDLFVVMT